MGERISWEHYFTDITKKVSVRATCDRLKVGSVIVKENDIIATGYNGSPTNEVHCIEDGCLMKDGSCIRTIHAEINAIMQCVKHGISLSGATIYVTHYPCYNCAKHIVQVGIKDIVYLEDYRNDPETEELFNRQGVKITKVDREQ